MNFTDWNIRTVPFFAEEMGAPAGFKSTFPSIKQFQQPGVYTPALRAQLAAYIGGCPGIVATSLARINAYTGAKTLSLAYYTDGEVIFNNLLREYILQPDFALPAAWLALIKQRNFDSQSLVLDEDKLNSQELNIFETTTQTFQEYPAVRKAMVAAPGQTNTL